MDQQPATEFLVELENIVRERLQRPETSSYTAKLAEAGVDRIAQKLGEEAIEVALASVVHGRADELRNEVADLVYHLIVLLAVHDIRFGEIVELLRARHSERAGAP